VYNLNYTPTTLGGGGEHKVVEKLHLGVREQKKLSTTGLIEAYSSRDRGQPKHL
jgi:hypothetical protein